MPVRWLEYIWNKGYTRLVKAIWYFALGMTLLTDSVGADLIVMYICFIEACDLTFQQLEIRRDRKKLKDAKKELPSTEEQDKLLTS